MESLGLKDLHQAYSGRRILITGHTGFKGSWLSLWLQLLGAEIKGFALPPEKPLNHFSLLELDMDSELGDIRDRDRLHRAVNTFRPHCIFHLAAQPLVKRSYEHPAETWSTNVMGLVNLLDVALDCDSVQAVINVTSDKCYENRNQARGYVETDPMGGHDPYSASKGCAELVTASYRQSFFASAGKLLASARAGNVVGGGDWSDNRLVPDVIRAIEQGGKVHIRRPDSTRPWQHVLEPLLGYLMLGQHLLAGESRAAEGWNFGSTNLAGCAVRDVLGYMYESWPVFETVFTPEEAGFHEADLLQLDSDKAKQRLGWRQLLDAPTAFASAMDWYKAYYTEGQVSTERQIHEYCAKAGVNLC